MGASDFGWDSRFGKDLSISLRSAISAPWSASKLASSDGLGPFSGIWA